MYNLAIYHPKEIPQQKNISKTHKIKEFFFSEYEPLLHHLPQMHGVILFTSNRDRQENVLDTLVNIKRHTPVPTWVYGETDGTSKKLHLELGVVGTLAQETSYDNLVQSIENTFRYIYQDRRVEMKEPTTEFSDRIQLNDLNCSIQLPNEQEISLTQLEYKFISLLATKMNQAFTYDEIYTNIWRKEKSYLTDNVDKKYRVSNLAFHIRHKLKNYSVTTDLIRTVRSVGYLLDTNVKVKI